MSAGVDLDGVVQRGECGGVAGAVRPGRERFGQVSHACDANRPGNRISRDQGRGIRWYPDESRAIRRSRVESREIKVIMNRPREVKLIPWRGAGG
ncbi:hypothetical protein GCM10009557_08630 [Virgisporangium ochraceum]|uniref:Uncharacterized protein n=1 Tax=Virgisporangium ochraceum TaxID=65505 RepID=A0A8J4E9K2_9ACTN|nr:hypothetical protein Voc01_022470 [Virgisporangium ochraceum]